MMSPALTPARAAGLPSLTDSMKTPTGCASFAFDGSSIEGFVRIEESDMYLKPDLGTFEVFPWTYGGPERVARIICDIANPDGSPFAGCPRTLLKQVVALAAERGYIMKAGPEAEFFLFQR